MDIFLKDQANTLFEEQKMIIKVKVVELSPRAADYGCSRFLF